MKNEKMDKMRTVCRTLGEGGETFTNAQIYAAMGAGPEDPQRRDRIRKRVTSLRQVGALEWVARGEYKYVGDDTRRDAPLLTNAWRAVKAAKPGFAVNDITKRSGASHSHVCGWFRHLEKEGFIQRMGRNGNSILYRATPLTAETKETPLPPKELRDPFATEREAVCELVQIFMVGDPYQPGAQAKILKHCRTITGRFEKDQEES